MGKKKNKRVNVVYSTNPDFDYEDKLDHEQETLPPSEQKLYISIDRKRRKGKEVTLIEGFVGTEDDLKELAKELKQACGVGGSAKNNEIIIQGNHRSKIADLLHKKGFNHKLKGG